MTQDNDSPLDTAAGAAAIPVRVWDWPVRLFHWALAVLLVAQVVTGTIGGASVMEWHLRGGYAILALVIFRLAWGFLGSHYARFASFVRGPGAAIRYARALFASGPAMHAGHTPLGGWMVVTLLVLLLAQAVLGLFANDDVVTEGPWTKFVTKDTSDLLTAWHGDIAWVLVGLAAVHVAAVLYYLAVRKENLVAPMITGVKRLPPALAACGEGGSSVRGLVVLALAAALVWWLVTKL